jgi:LPS export ABC transporter protein LptC
MRRFRIFLAAALASMVLGILAAYWLNQPAKLQLKEDTGAVILNQDGRPHVKGLTYTQVRNGLKRWTLFAEGARYDNSSGHVALVKVKVDYFPDKEGLMTILGDEGEYDQQNQVMILRGNVCVRTHDGIRLKAEYLTYSERDQVLESDSWLTLSGERFSVTGKGVIGSMQQRILVFKSQVDSTFIPSGKGQPPGTTADDDELETTAGGKQ